MPKRLSSSTSALAAIFFSTFLVTPASAASPESLGQKTKKAGRAAIGAIKETTLLGHIDLLDLHLRERRARTVEKKARAALEGAKAVRSKARRLEDKEAEGVADRAVAIAREALDRVRTDLGHLTLITFAFKKFRQAYGAKIGAIVDEMMEEKYGFYHNPALEKRLIALVARLKKFSLRPGESLRVRILNTSRVTTYAAASPTTIYFDKAYLDLKPSADELVFITSHELAHAELDHGVQGVPFITALTVKDAIAGKVQRVLDRFKGARSGTNQQRNREAIRKAGQKVAWGQYTQEQERQADLLGAKIALSSGASPQGIKSAFDRMGARVARRPSRLRPPEQKLRALTSSHPTPASRLKNLERILGPRFWEK